MKYFIFIISIFISQLLVAQSNSNEPEEVIYKTVDDIELKLHIYKPDNFDNTKQYNTIVFFHGGGWSSGSYMAFNRQSEYFASRGLIAISADYRIKNLHGTTPFESVEDAKSAIRYVRKHAKELNVNPNMIAAGGGSAGGHIAAAAGNIVGLEGPNEELSVSSIPDALVLFNPVYDNSKDGFGYGRMNGRYLEISPLHNITKGAPPTIVFFGTNDATTPVASSLAYEKRMKEVGSRIDLILYEGAEHSFFNRSPYLEQTLLAADNFLESLGYIKKKPDSDKSVFMPNIVWIVAEDISPDLSFYGDNTAKTPNLDRLASQSTIYENAFTPVGVCAPSRSSIITGRYPTTIGTTHMRTATDYVSWGNRVYEKTDRVDIANNPIIQYSAVIPEEVRLFPEYLREKGYFATNNNKADYQFAAPITAWNQNGDNGHWRNREGSVPFFSVFNFNITHESQLWKQDDKPLTVKPSDVKVPPYLPDNDLTRQTIARHYSNIELLDAEVGELIAKLKDDDLYENTIIFFYSDHGGPLPREKREIYDSGLKVPFMVKGINQTESRRTDELISFVDLAPTILSIVDIQPPSFLDGQAFMGNYKAEPRNFVFGSSDRFDGFTDRIRSIRNKRYLYLRNSFPELTKYKDVEYRKNIKMMPAFLQLRENGELNKEQQIWFGTKVEEELYDTVTDPNNLNNLIDNPAYSSIKNTLSAGLDEFQLTHTDLGAMPEAELIESMWPGFVQPVTEKVEFTTKGKRIHLSCKTKAAGIAYQILDLKDDLPKHGDGWQLYTRPIKLNKGEKIVAIAERIGYKESEITVFEFNN